MRVLLDPDSITRGLRRIAVEIIERHRGTDGLVLLGVRRGGVPIAQRIAEWVRDLEGIQIPVGSVDITLYRDDAATALPNPRIGPSEMPGPIDGKRVVICDDVVFTGRTVRAAIDAVLDYGRPRRIELAAIIDRGGRELPIQPDYVLKQVEVTRDDRVDVLDEGDGLQAVVQPVTTPSVTPPKAQ
jgi:pyrimidine operon attenuation protein/uracil phosphoribosyltransferase